MGSIDRDRLCTFQRARATHGKRGFTCRFRPGRSRKAIPIPGVSNIAQIPDCHVHNLELRQQACASHKLWLPDEQETWPRPRSAGALSSTQTIGDGRRKALTDDPAPPLGLPWYRREDYPAILATMHDAQLLPPTWEEWLENAERVELDMKANDHVVIRVTIDPETFPAWCVAHGLNVDAEARSRFAGEAAGR